MPPSLIIKEATQVRAAAHGRRAMQLAEYINDATKCVGHVDVNMERHETRESMAREMAAICDAVDPTGKRKLMQHWILAWRVDAGEAAPTKEEMYAAGREAMQGIGYGKCPYSMAIHANTAHPHVHIAVARVEQLAGVIIRDSYTHLRAQKTGAEIVARHGWQQSPGHLFEMRDGEIVRKGRGKRGDIRTKTVMQEREKLEGKRPEKAKLADILEEFCTETRDRWSAWKWGDLHKALALKGVEMQYTQHGDAGGLAFSADGKTWEKASKACPELSYNNIAKQLGASGSYRKARAGIAKIAADARANRPALSCPEPQEAAQAQPPRQEAAQTQGAPRAPEKEERKEMTDAQLQYLALLARERADERTRKTLEAMEKAANIDFYRRNEDILKALYDSRYTDADAYARLMHNATRYHLRRIAADEARRRRDDEETRRNRRQYAAFHAHAAQHATAGQDARRIAAIMMYRAGASASDIAARMVAGMMDENPAMMSASEYIADQIGEQIGAALDALTTEMLRERGRWERRDREIAKIEDAYADMSIHAPAEYREGMEERKQEAIAAARALAAWEERQERAAQREAQREAKKQQDQPPTPTAADARIFARHATEAEKTAPSKEKTNEMIALRLRACGHKADDAVRIMCAGMDVKAAMDAVASMYRTAHGDEMMRIARDCASQWRREEQGQTTIRHNGGATQAQRPAAAAAPRPRM